MKNNLNDLINKLVTYAEDELMLDALDETYTLNKLAALVGVTPKKADVDYGDASLADLIGELKAEVPEIDAKAVIDILLPLPHTVNYYFNDEFERNREKAFDFVFDLYALALSAADKPSGSADGFTHYCAEGADFSRSVALTVGSDSLKYTPVSVGGKVAALECRDFMSEDIARREADFCETYGMAIAKRGEDNEYYCCQTIAPSRAKTIKLLSDGVVKTSLLDYPVPVLAVSGPKNSAARTAAELIKKASESGLSCVLACEKSEWLTFYIVFAKDTAADELFAECAKPLSACGVFATADTGSIQSVLAKGTALSTDLFAFKPIYSAIGGVKLGDKAAAALAAELAKSFKANLAAAASADSAAVEALTAKSEE